MSFFTQVVVVTVFAGSLAGCTLPRSGPDDKLLDQNAIVKVSTKARKVGIDYALVDISKGTLLVLGDAGSASIKESFGGGRGAPPEVPLGYGDVVEVSIFESQSGGLFIPSDAGSRPGNYITLPAQTIDRRGTLSVPYAGRISAAGRIKEEVEQEIENALASRAIEPQVVLTTVSRRSSRVAVLGDVNSPRKVEISAAGDRILDVISEAGGLSTPGIETKITLQRRGRTASVPYEVLLQTPAENIFVAPDDTVVADHERRTFLAFGAMAQNGRFDFEDTNLTLGEALGKAGGLRDDQADPAQIFVYRSVPRTSLAKLGVNLSHFPLDEIPTVFRVNLKDPSAYFAAQAFQMRDKDILYVANSDSVELLKLLDIANSVTSTAAGTTTDVVSTRDAVRNIN